MKRRMALIGIVLTICLMPIIAFADDGDIASGDHWRITNEYELIIGEEGFDTSLNQYRDSTGSYLWKKYSNKIKKISFSGTVIAYNYQFESLFSGSKLTSIDLTGLDTSNVTDMGRMFYGCSSLTSIDFTGLDTSNVTTMSDMFCDCSSLTSIDMRGLDTSNVTFMGDMFCDCSSLTSIDMRGLDTSKLSNMVNMFSGCSSLTNIDLTGLDTSNVIEMSGMFKNCSKLTSIELTGLDTSNVINMGSMFYGCSSLTSIDFTGLDTSNVAYMYEMFYGCSSLTSIDLTGLDTSNVYEMDSMFFGCSNLTDIALDKNTKFQNDIGLDNSWTRYKLLSGTKADGPYIEKLYDYTGEDPGWYTTLEEARIYGSTRYETAIAVADKYKGTAGKKFKNVVVAYGKNFPDALAGGYLAKVKDAPILLVDASVENQIANYINSNIESGGTVYLLGGTGVVSSSFENKIKARTERLGGKDRYETNLKILKAAGVTNEDILVCTGTGYADSLSASAAGLPILLVANNLNGAQKSYLKSLGASKFYLIGGTGAVKPAIESDLRGLGYNSIERLAGSTRYETSTAVAKKFFPNTKTVMLAYAKNFPDGLSGGPLAMKRKAPIILTDSKTTGAAQKYAKDSGAKWSITLGGTSLISDSAVKTIMGR